MQSIPLVDADQTGHPTLPEAIALMHQSRPKAGDAHVWQTQEHHHLFVTQGSQLFDLPAPLATQVESALVRGDHAGLLARLGVDGSAVIDDEPPKAMPIHAFSLAIAQKCNLGCTYCYAQQGEFGGVAKNMPLKTALQAVDQLIAQTPEGGAFNLAFMGGEPLVNRPVLQAATEHAATQAMQRGLQPRFSITTNGTLVTEQDADFFEQHGFAVTVSLDGVGDTHDQLRPFKGSRRDGRQRGSFERIMANIAPLLSQQRQMQVSARVTVTPQNLGLKEMLDYFLAEGFHSAGFSPMLNAPNGQGEMGREDMQYMLAEMIDCGQEFERRTRAGQRYAFSNLLNALRELGKGTHRPYPCGAGAGYMGVSAEGGLYACHRFVDDDAGALGTLDALDTIQQHNWLQQRHVHRQQPCQQCWAKYLCGGGCHHEVIGKGRHACDYVRGWLQYAMGMFLRLGNVT